MLKSAQMVPAFALEQEVGSGKAFGLTFGFGADLPSDLVPRATPGIARLALCPLEERSTDTPALPAQGRETLSSECLI